MANTPGILLGWWKCWLHWPGWSESPTENKGDLLLQIPLYRMLVCCTILPYTRGDGGYLQCFDVGGICGSHVEALQVGFKHTLVGDHSHYKSDMVHIFQNIYITSKLTSVHQQILTFL